MALPLTVTIARHMSAAERLQRLLEVLCRRPYAEALRSFLLKGPQIAYWLSVAPFLWLLIQISSINFWEMFREVVDN